MPAADAEKPVTHVSLAEARGYCAHYGKRLPHTWEWQLAAQGTDGRVYPWGNATDGLVDGVHCPLLQNRTATADGGVVGLLANVTAHPAGASPYGVLDLVGNVWQMTDEFVDEHSRAVVLRGGSVYYPSVPGCSLTDGCRGTPVNWYFPNSLAMRSLYTHGKYFLMAPSYERAGTVGFRCAADG